MNGPYLASELTDAVADVEVFQRAVISAGIGAKTAPAAEVLMLMLLIEMRRLSNQVARNTIPAEDIIEQIERAGDE